MHKLKSPIVPEDSPLRKPPLDLSRKQVLLLDGIRYAAEMSDLAYERLFDNLKEIKITKSKLSTCDIASMMLDAWSVVDAVHRFTDLVGELPGLKHGTWLELLKRCNSDVLDLRNCVQHQQGEIDNLIENKGQIWGYLSWAEVDNNENHTGKWLMISPGAKYAGDKWSFAGPSKLGFSVPPGRIRLNAFGKCIYLGRHVQEVQKALNHIADELTNGRIRVVGQPASDRRGTDMLLEGYIEVLTSNSQNEVKIMETLASKTGIDSC